MYLVVSVGKWRRAVRIENQDSTNTGVTMITHCTSTALTTDSTRLPRNQTEGVLPKIALSTGSADALECLLRGGKLGIADTEFTNPTGTGSVNLFGGGDAGNQSQGTLSYKAGGTFPTSNPWWNTASNWNAYDIVLLSCEGAQNANDKSAMAESNLQSYLGAGGRVFASHWHNIWISNAPSPLSTVATFQNDSQNTYQNDATAITATINQNFDKGMALANWLQLPAVQGSTTLGQLVINHSRVTIDSNSSSLTQNWVTWANGALTAPLENPASQYFSLYAPVGAQPANQCGEMVFTDIHVSGGVGDVSNPSNPFPSGCTTTGLTPQEKALIFMLFDLTNCIQPVIG
jgi:hypothetical protein